MVTRLQLRLFSSHRTLIVSVLRRASQVVHYRSQFTQRGVDLRTNFLLISAMFGGQAFLAIGSGFQVVSFRRVTNFSSNFRITVGRLHFGNIIEVNFVARTTSIVDSIVQTARREGGLIRHVRAGTVGHTVLQRPEFNFYRQTMVIGVTFRFGGLSRLTAFGHFFHYRRTKIGTAVLVQHSNRPFTFHRHGRLLHLNGHQNRQFFSRRVFPNFRHTFHMLRVTIHINTSGGRLGVKVI